MQSKGLSRVSLTRRTLVGKVMSLLLNMLSRFVITFLPRRKRLLISWLQSPPAVILEPAPKIKSDSVSTVSPKQTRSPHLLRAGPRSALDGEALQDGPAPFGGGASPLLAR